MFVPLYKTGIWAFEGRFKGRKTFRYLEELERTQWLGHQELEAIQFEALKRLISHAYEHCPYYRENWSRMGLDPSVLKTPADFRLWPIIDRTHVAEHRLNLRTRQPGAQLIAKSTGGSTGVPVHFDLNSDSNDRRMAAWHRGYNWAGAGLGTKQFYFWGVALGQQPAWKRWKDRAYNALYRRKIVNVFDFSEQNVPLILDQLNAYRPDAIVAYTNPLDLLAREFEARQLRPFSPRSIVVGAEKLHSFQRERIERVFRAPVFETYGSREFMLIGAECDRHEGLHLTMEHLLVEVVDDQGQPAPEGTEGNIVVTDLYNYGMPFIRYSNGDRGVAGWGTCSCGRGLPLLRKVVGRQLDVLLTPDGRHIPGEFFPHLLKDFPAISRFQVVQEELDQIQLRVVLRGSWTESDRQILDRELTQVLGSSTRIAFSAVDDIPLTAAGKHRVVVNQLANAASSSSN